MEIQIEEDCNAEPLGSDAFGLGVPQFDCARTVRERSSGRLEGGILVTDVMISGTRTLSATELARITGELTGNCFNDDSEEIGERVRALFQDRGYFLVEVKSAKLKPSDPLAIPKPVTLEAEVAEGPKFKVGEITFVENHAFSAEKLRQQFPLKAGAVFERGKVAAGLDSLRKLYGTNGYLDEVAIPETQPGSNAIMNLNLTFEEGPQYRLDKVEFVGKKEMVSGCRCNGDWQRARCTTIRILTSTSRSTGNSCRKDLGGKMCRLRPIARRRWCTSA